jgi:8-oxo-dGTP pyrophosphatase MutT (NUDIX family)
MRISAIIIKDKKILLIHRLKEGKDYYVFPGGSIEDGETEEIALEREIKEELNLEIADYKKVFEIENLGRKEFYYLINDFSGKMEIGSPEKEGMNENNKYLIEWIGLDEIAKMNNLYPVEAVEKVLKIN